MVKKTLEKSKAAIQFDNDELELIRENKATGATEAEFKLFIYDCISRGLNPLKNEIHFVKRKIWNGQKQNYDDRAIHQVGIDGFRVIAQRTGQYEGQTETRWSDKIVTISGVTCPEWCEVGVWRKGFREALYARAYFEEYVPVFSGKVSTMWAKMPRTMLEKCAESKALRKAFPDTLAGLYTDEEMLQANRDEHVRKEMPSSQVIEEFESAFDELRIAMQWNEEKRKEMRNEILVGKNMKDLSDSWLLLRTDQIKEKIGTLQKKKMQKKKEKTTV